MGCERAPFILVAMFTSMIAFLGFAGHLYMFGVAALFWSLFIYALRKLAKYDPEFVQVYLSGMKHKDVYIDQSTPFCAYVPPMSFREQISRALSKKKEK